MEPMRKSRDDEEPEVQFDGRAWTTLGERGSLLAGEGWRYTPRGQVRHYTATSGGFRASACALISDNPKYWRGTGTQEEYERLTSLPKCLNCEAIFKHGEELRARAER